MAEPLTDAELEMMLADADRLQPLGPGTEACIFFHIRFLVREVRGLRKAEALLRAGMESQAEQMHELKQENRALKAENALFRGTIEIIRDARQPAEGDRG